jgi:hypothetical protein
MSPICAPKTLVRLSILSLLVAAGCATTPKSDEAGSSTSKSKVAEKAKYEPAPSDANQRYEKWCTEERDYLDDGQLERVIKREFDEEGRMIFYATDRDGDGELDKGIHYTYKGGQRFGKPVDPQTREPVEQMRTRRSPRGGKTESITDGSGRPIALVSERRRLVQGDNGQPVRSPEGGWKYDVVGQEVELIYYDEAGNKIARFETQAEEPGEMPAPKELHAQFERDKAGSWKVPELDGLQVEKATLVQFNEDGKGLVTVIWKDVDPKSGVPLPGEVRERFPFDKPHRVEPDGHYQTVHAPVPEDFKAHLERIIVNDYDKGGAWKNRLEYLRGDQLFTRILTRPGDEPNQTFQLIDGGARVPNIMVPDGIFELERVQTLVDGERVASRDYRLYFDPSIPHGQIPEAYRSVPIDSAGKQGEAAEPERALFRTSDTARDVHGNPVEKRTMTIRRIVHRSYDDEGRVTAEKIDTERGHFLSKIDGKPDKTIRHTYDEDGREVRTEETWLDLKHKENTKVTKYTYDDRGHLAAEVSTVTERGGQPRSYGNLEHEYDEQGRKKRTRSIGRDGQPSRIVDYAYDADGRLSTETIASPKSSRSRPIEHRYHYDEQGDLVEETRKYTEEEATFYRKSYSYNDDGHIELTRTYGRKNGGRRAKASYMTRYSYDENGNPIKEVEQIVRVYRYGYACREKADASQTVAEEK